MVMVSCFQVFVKENVQSSKISKLRRYNPKPLEAKIIPKQRSNDLFNTKRTQKKSAKEAGYHNMMNPWGKMRIPSTTPSPPKKGHPQKCPQQPPRTLAQAPCRTEGAAGDEIGRLKKGHLIRCRKNWPRICVLTRGFLCMFRLRLASWTLFFVPRIFMSVGSHVSSLIILRLLWLDVATVRTKVWTKTLKTSYPKKL